MAKDRHLITRAIRERFRIMPVGEEAEEDDPILIPGGCPHCHGDTYLLILDGPTYMYGACEKELISCPFYETISPLEAEVILSRLEAII